MQLDTFLLFAPACFAINMAFGPNNLLSLTNAARSGIAPAILAAAGRIVSFAIMIAIAGVGLGAISLHRKRSSRQSNGPVPPISSGSASS
jgi:threonine/homoserine/homoserine lactone efflux protein